VLADINACVVQIDVMIFDRNVHLPPNPELVLELIQADGADLMCGYYFVDHENRCLFWVEPIEMSVLLMEVKGVTCPSHISASSRTFFHFCWLAYCNCQDMKWGPSTGAFRNGHAVVGFEIDTRAHWHLFPDVRELPLTTVRELRDILIYAMGGKLLHLDII
jgi:hypothetical protein